VPLLGLGSGALTLGGTRRADDGLATVSGHHLKDGPELPPKQARLLAPCRPEMKWPPRWVCVPRVTLPPRLGLGTGSLVFVRASLASNSRARVEGSEPCLERWRQRATTPEGQAELWGRGPSEVR